MDGGGAGRVKVFARLRPPSPADGAIFAPAVEAGEGGMVRVRGDSDSAVERVLQGHAAPLEDADSRSFTFDGVFAGDVTQREVFGQLGLPVLRECLKGFNGTVLAYGQTGSGKTHSLLNQGPKGEDAGLLPRLVAALFVHISQDVANVYEIEAAAVQVYNEQVDDLLHPEHVAGAGTNINVQSGGVVPGLTWIKCTSPHAMLDSFGRARANVVYAETKMNKSSSRSHAVFQVRITKRQRVAAATGSGAAQRMECTRSLLSVVDLAGSERVKKSGVQGMQFKEATNINKSLLAFGNVVSALAAKKDHIPLRDSKLTKILDGSIGGNCKTVLLVCASAAAENASETVSTFDFASRAMRVEVDAKVNVGTIDVSAKALLADLNPEGDLGGVPLNAQLEALRKQNAEAAEKAQSEAQRREKMAAEAAKEAEKLQKAAKESEQRERKWQDELETMRRSHKDFEGEAKRLRESLGSASESAATWQKSAEEKNKDADKLRVAVKKAESSAEEWRAAAEQRAKEVAELKKKHEAAMATQKKEVTKAAEVAAGAASRAAKTVERANTFEDEAGKWRKLADEASAQVETVRKEADNRVVDVEAQAYQERKQAFVSLQAAAEEAESLRQQCEETRRDGAALEEKIQDLTKQLQAGEAASDVELRKLEAAFDEEVRKREAALKEQALAHEAALDEANVALAAFKVEADTKECMLRAAAAASLEQKETDHEAVVAQLGAMLERVRAEAAATQEADHERFVVLEEAVARKESAWAEQRVLLVAAHAAALEAQRVDFEAQLESGRKDFEERLAAMERQSRADQDALMKLLEDQREAQEAAEARWRDAKDEAVREVWETGTVQQRRLAAAFKAARNIHATKAAELATAHESLAARYAARESRPEDVQALLEQKRCLEQQQRDLRQREVEVNSLGLELENRDATDRIFSHPEMRRHGHRAGSEDGRRRYGIVPPLPGKKLGEAFSFAERDQRRRSQMRQPSLERARFGSASFSLTAAQLSVR